MAENTAPDTARKGPKRDARGRVSGGNPGNKGGTGRPPNDFKSFLKKEIRENPEAQKALIAAAADPDSRNFGNAWKLAADYDDEKPAEKHTIVGPVEVRVRIEREGRRVTAS